jgi:hypothetical protein
MEGLTSLLPRVLRESGDSPEAVEQCVFAAWVSVVGSHVSRVTAPLGLNQKHLLVAVLDDSWRIQLQKMSNQIVFKINAILGSVAVRTIDLAVNKARVCAAHPQRAPVTFSAPAEYALPLRQKADLIPDQDLREAFLRVAGKCLERAAARSGASSNGLRTDNINQ